MSATKRIAPAKKVAAKKVAATKTLVAKKAATKVAAKKVATTNSLVTKEAAKRVPAKKPPASRRAPYTEGIAFPDAGFHIAVLGALLEIKSISAEMIQSTLEGLDFDEDTSETDRLLAAMGRLHGLKLDPKELARIKSLDFDGGNEIYMLLEDGAEVETGGEDDTYELRALTGIAALCGLKKLNLDGHGYRAKVLDLKPLADHPALETLTLTGKNKSAKTLETLPKLKHLDLQSATIDTATVIDRLAKRGVDIVRGK
jgi:hypothetical protein